MYRVNTGCNWLQAAEDACHLRIFTNHQLAKFNVRKQQNMWKLYILHIFLVQNHRHTVKIKWLVAVQHINIIDTCCITKILIWWIILAFKVFYRGWPIDRFCRLIGTDSWLLELSAKIHVTIVNKLWTLIINIIININILFIYRVWFSSSVVFVQYPFEKTIGWLIGISQCGLSVSLKSTIGRPLVFYKITGGTM